MREQYVEIKFVYFDYDIDVIHQVLLMLECITLLEKDLFKQKGNYLRKKLRLCRR